MRMKILQYEIQPEVNDADKPYQRQITLDRCRQLDGDDKWALRKGSAVLTKDGEWEYEPMPSSRTSAFLRRARFDSPIHAVKVYETTLSTPNLNPSPEPCGATERTTLNLNREDISRRNL